MSWKKVAAFAALTAISFTGNYLVSASMVTAKANEAIAEYVPGGTHMNEWCNPSNFSNIEWIASWALRDLDLSGEQKAKFDKVMAASRQSIAKARTLCAFDRETVHALPAPEQLDAAKAMLGEAQMVIGEISGPFTEFHASLNPEQVRKFEALMQHEDGHKGRGWWHRRG